MYTHLALYNTLTRRLERLLPQVEDEIRMYSCGPTVYRSVHIGNLRTYLLADWLRRVLEQSGHRVNHVVNITDVGHMRQEMLDRGEDKVIAAALAEGKTPAEITQFYTESFWRDIDRLGIQPAGHYPRATEHIGDMIAIVEKLLRDGYAYEVKGNVYFDTSRFAAYGELSGNRFAELLEGVRVEADELKRTQHDFALWKSAEPGRMMHWPSPWGEGFPGWHIECSAMSTRFLGPRLDIHTGGVDNIFPHHEDERAQSEAAFGPPFVRHWVHGQHLLVDGLKMAKSTGNSYTLADLEGRGYDPMAFRYLCLGAHYRARMNFTFEALRAAQRALERLRVIIRRRPAAGGPAELSGRSAPWLGRFWSCLYDDLNLPQALATTWEMLHASLPETERTALLLQFDRVLGLRLAEVEAPDPPPDLCALVEKRSELRTARSYEVADALREQLLASGYGVSDGRSGTRLELVPAALPARERSRITATSDVESRLTEPDAVEFSINLVVSDYLGDTRRCIESILSHCHGESLEILAVDNGSTDDTAEWLDERAAGEPRLRVLHADHNLGEGGARNVAVLQSCGTFLVLLDASIEFTGNVLPMLRTALSGSSVGVAGGWGVVTGDLRHFQEAGSQECDAIEGYCFAFRRSLASQVGLMDEKYRFYRNLDLDYSFAIRDRGYRAVVVPDLPLIRHEHRLWASLSDEEREGRSKKNFARFLHKWGDRHDLASSPPGSQHAH